MRHVLAIDEGTTGATAIVISEAGKVVGRGYCEIAQHFPQPGWVEHEADELFSATLAAGRAAIAASGVTPDALGLTNQRETLVAWDRRTSRPLHRAIVWQDRRTAARCRELAPHAAMLRARTGLVTDPYFTATKLEWLVRERGLLDGAQREHVAAGTVDSWLLWKLTGGATFATDHTNASRTMLYDIDERRWSPECCDLFGVPESLLPEVRASIFDYGTAGAEHFGVALPILGVAGDQQAALFGQGCVDAGDAKNTYGTGAFLLMNAGRSRPAAAEGILVTIACDHSGAPVYALEAAILVAGAAVQWLRDGLGIIGSAMETEEMARSLASNEGVYFVPALTGLGAPEWEPEARGTIVGLTRGTNRAHFARAALEAMAYGTADVIDAMNGGAGSPFSGRLRVDGGATSNDWLMQFQADVLGASVERPANVETTVLGAAGLAGIGAGIWADHAAFQSRNPARVFEPGAGQGAAQAARHGWSRAMRATLGWARDRDE
ncbi:MAG: glpK [Gemmatimonadetes bacterium]|nr:glpK [Gemmatimonadota bacterium]